jgi:hypothetical protein
MADGSGYYTVTGITGTRNGSAITALLAQGSFWGNDNLFNPTAPYFTYDGVAFKVDNQNVSLYSYTNPVLTISDFTANSGNLVDTEITFTANAAGVPEPSDIGGLAILLSMGGLMIRKFKTSQKPTTFIAETRKETLV